MLADAWYRVVRGEARDERDRSVEELAAGCDVPELLAVCEGLEAYRAAAPSLYERVRAALCLRWIYRFRLADSPAIAATGLVPVDVYRDFLAGRYEGAVAGLDDHVRRGGPDGASMQAFATVYERLGFRTLRDQVQASVRASDGNRWMFGSPELRAAYEESPLRIQPWFASGTREIREQTPVRLDLSHSGWSDIFFLAMDAPESARVVNASVALRVRGTSDPVRPPIDVRVRGIDRPRIRLHSVDLDARAEIDTFRELFDYGRDHLGLLKAGVVASGAVPARLETADAPLSAWLETILGEGRGFEVVTRVRGIPKGSRLAVSTMLLSSILAALQRATGQTRNVTGPLDEDDRRLVASRAILGEWLGGSGGGWQDSGGLWPGVKVIEGCVARPGDAEHGVSRGRLLPSHRILEPGDGVHPELGERLRENLVLVHGGLAQDVGPVLESVTDRYLLHLSDDRASRGALRTHFDDILGALATADIPRLARATTQSFDGPLRTILPWIDNAFTTAARARVESRLGHAALGFLMLGGTSGGGMGFFVDGHAGSREAKQDAVLEELVAAKRSLEQGLAFAMDPVVYDFEIDAIGTRAELGEPGVEAEAVPTDFVATVGEPTVDTGDDARPSTSLPTGLLEQREAQGFDADAHERLRARLRAGEIGQDRNRLPKSARVEDVDEARVVRFDRHESRRASDLAAWRELGEAELRERGIAVVTLAGGLGTRWSGGAGVVKAVHPFAVIGGRYRSFLEIQVAKTAVTARRYGVRIPHVVTTSFLTRSAIEAHVSSLREDGFGRSARDVEAAPIELSHGRAIGQRFVPRVTDLEAHWRDAPDETLDEPREKLRESVRGAWIAWARAQGEGADYVQNRPAQCLHPPGHWYEVANLLRNGRLASLIDRQPTLRTLVIHNLDTLGFSVDPVLLGHHLASAHALTFEVVPRRFGDRGGGLASVDGRLRIVEELAQPEPESDLGLRYYNSMTTWIDLDRWLATFGLDRSDLGRADRVDAAVRVAAERLPAYVTIKEVKRRFGLGHEEVVPVAQCERLWSDMTALDDVGCGFVVVPRRRGQQLKSPDQLDEWARDGSMETVEALLR